MTFYRLIKATWGRPLLANGEPNPKFEQEIIGDDTIDGCDLDLEFIQQKNLEGYNAYFFPNHPSRNVHAEDKVIYLNGKHIDVFDFIFVDMDLKDGIYPTKQAFLDELNSFELKPTMTVDSGNGIHAYWRISNLTRDAYVLTQLALINRFNTDKSVYTVLQLLRLPGSINVKVRDNPIPAEILENYSSGEDYTLEQIPQEIYALPADVVTRAQNHLNKLDGKLKINLPEFINVDELPDRFVDFLEDSKNVAAYNLFHSPKATIGDRSVADMKLANILFRNDFNKKEVMAVISNTEKALEKGASRYSYAETTVDKVYTDKLTERFKTVGQTIRTTDPEKNLGALVKGPWYFDTEVLGFPWRKKEMLGLIAGSGVGKTAVTLKIVKDAIENNPDNDDVYLFFSLEMTEGEIIERWTRLVGSNSPLADRLYIIGNEELDGTPRNLGLQEILEYSEEIKKLSGKNLGIVAIDHIGIIAKHIDVRKKNQFGIMSEVGSGKGDVRTLSLNSLASQLKNLTKMLDTHLIVLTQTTKEKGKGDDPIDKDGAYGISQYEHIMDRIITIWQPLMRVQEMTRTRFLAFQYVKIRSKSTADKIQTHEPKLMTYNLETGNLELTSDAEYAEFNALEPLAQEARKKQFEKKGGLSYSINIGQLDSKVREALKLVPRSGS